LEDFFIHEIVPGLNAISDELDSRLDIFMKLFIILYADDTVLMTESSSNLQTLLDKFYSRIEKVIKFSPFRTPISHGKYSDLFPL
jgi:hypothetical protein